MFHEAYCGQWNGMRRLVREHDLRLHCRLLQLLWSLFAMYRIELYYAMCRGDRGPAVHQMHRIKVCTAFQRMRAPHDRSLHAAGSGIISG